jgi:Rho-binding antiterminator
VTPVPGDGARPYEPIDCSLHDRLESFATLGTRCRITFDEPSGNRREVVDRIRDVFARSGEEFIETSAAGEIRLDRLVRVEPEEPG